MSKLGDVLGFGGGGPVSEEMPPSIPEDVDALDAKAEKPTGDAEVMAMQMFMKASTAEAKVEALKGFLSACGVMDY
jgi:hypothetical protein